jgi:hypothetical protein
MSILLFDEEPANGKINIDDLYEKKQKRELKQISIFNKILSRIHKRIQHTAKNKHAETFVWFHIPEYIVGEPIYDKGECTGFIVSKLEDNGFHVKYVHPNTLFISWHNWVPSYVRNEIKKKMGIVIDEKGNIIDRKGNDEDKENPESRIFLSETQIQNQKDQKQYNSIKNYRPTGNLVYSNDILEKVEKKITFR